MNEPRYFASKQDHLHWIVWDRVEQRAVDRYMGYGSHYWAARAAALLEEKMQIASVDPPGFRVTQTMHTGCPVITEFDQPSIEAIRETVHAWAARNPGTTITETQHGAAITWRMEPRRGKPAVTWEAVPREFEEG